MFRSCAVRAESDRRVGHCEISSDILTVFVDVLRRLRRFSTSSSCFGRAASEFPDRTSFCPIRVLFDAVPGTDASVPGGRPDRRLFRLSCCCLLTLLRRRQSVEEDFSKRYHRV